MKAINNFPFGNKRNIVFYSFLLVYFAFLIFLGYEKVIWEDEAFSLHTSSTSIANAIHLSYFFEDQPPVYFVVLALWRKINASILFARMLSMTFTFLSALVLHQLGKTIFVKLYSKWVIVLFLLNPFTFWASIEIRLYSMLIFLSFLTIYLFFLIFYYNRHKLKIFFILVSTIGIYTQYYFVFLIISLSLLLLFSKGWRTFFNFCLMSSVLLILFSPNLLIIPKQYSMALHFAQEARSLIGWIATISYAPMQFWFAIYETHIGLIGRWIFFIIFAAFFILIIKKFATENKKQPINDYVIIYQLFIPIISILFFFTVIFIKSDLFYAHRYMTIVYPFFCLLYASINIFNTKIRNFIFIGFSVYYIFVLCIIYHPPILKYHDHRAVATYVHKIEQKNEPVLFRQTAISLAFKQYYKGKNQIIAVPERKFDFSYYKDDVKDSSEFKQLLDRGIAHSKSFILVNTLDDNYIETQLLTNEVMDSLLNKHFQTSKDTIIYGKKHGYGIRIRRILKNR